MAKRLTTKIDYASRINAGGDIGYHNADSHGRAVDAAKFCKSSKRALEQFSANYVCGYVAASLVRQGLASWGNLPVSEQVENARSIVNLKPAKKSGDTFLPDCDQPDGYRTERQHKAVRAGQTSLASVLRAAGIAAKKGGGRAPRPSTTEPEGNLPPVDLVKAAPELKTRDAANEYFATAAAALLATVNKNVKAGRGNPILPAVSTAVQTFREALIAAGLMAA